MTGRAVLLAATAALSIAGCGGGEPEKADPSKLDQPAQFACDDFAKGYSSAVTSAARQALAVKVNEWAPKSATTGIPDRAAALGPASEASASAWRVAADSFAQACLDAGWKG